MSFDSDLRHHSFLLRSVQSPPWQRRMTKSDRTAQRGSFDVTITSHKKLDFKISWGLFQIGKKLLAKEILDKFFLLCFICVNVKPICGPVYLLYPTSKTPPQEKIYGAFLSGQTFICFFFDRLSPRGRDILQGFFYLLHRHESSGEKLSPASWLLSDALIVE